MLNFTISSLNELIHKGYKFKNLDGIFIEYYYGIVGSFLRLLSEATHAPIILYWYSAKLRWWRLTNIQKVGRTIRFLKIIRSVLLNVRGDSFNIDKVYTPHYPKVDVSSVEIEKSAKDVIDDSIFTKTNTNEPFSVNQKVWIIIRSDGKPYITSGEVYEVVKYSDAAYRYAVKTPLNISIRYFYSSEIFSTRAEAEKALSEL